MLKVINALKALFSPLEMVATVLSEHGIVTLKEFWIEADQNLYFGGRWYRGSVMLVVAVYHNIKSDRGSLEIGVEFLRREITTLSHNGAWSLDPRSPEEDESLDPALRAQLVELQAALGELDFAGHNHTAAREAADLIVSFFVKQPVAAPADEAVVGMTS